MSYMKQIKNQLELEAGVKTLEEVLFEIVSTDIKPVNYGIAGKKQAFFVKPHCWIVDAKEFDNEGMKLPTDVWVRWGWFEDNVLSKFTTLFADSTESKIKSQFRSIEPRLLRTGRNSGIYESTRIRNHKFLQTTDTNKYILPGQFKVLPRGFEGFVVKMKEGRTFLGDDDWIGYGNGTHIEVNDTNQQISMSSGLGVVVSSLITGGAISVGADQHGTLNTYSSDYKLKKNIEPIESALKKVLDMESQL